MSLLPTRADVFVSRVLHILSSSLLVRRPRPVEIFLDVTGVDWVHVCAVLDQGCDAASSAADRWPRRHRIPHRCVWVLSIKIKILHLLLLCAL